MEKLSVILPAAGKSTRFGGGDLKKVFTPLAGKPVWLRSAEVFSSLDFVHQIVVVLSPEDLNYFQATFSTQIEQLGLLVVPGGDQRYQSVHNGLAALFPEQFAGREGEPAVRPAGDQAKNWVAIHDAARPLVRSEQVEKVFAEAKKTGAAILASPVTATMKKVSKQVVQGTVDRTNLFSAQTPQIFQTTILAQAYRQAQESGQESIPTDECLLLESAGIPVSVVEGDDQNLKLTHQTDMVLAEAILATRKLPSGSAE